MEIQLIADDNNEDISTADSFELHILKPDTGEVIRPTGDIAVSGTKKVLYTLKPTDTDELGTYRAHVRFIKTTPPGNIFFPVFIYHTLKKYAGAGEGGKPNTLVQ